MKKVTFLVLGALVVQATAPLTLSADVGIKAGFSLSKFAVESSVPLPLKWENLSSFMGGLTFGTGFGYLSLQPEILYARTGGRSVDGTTTLEFRFEYIQVPVLLKFRIIPAGPVCPFLFGGGYGAYLFKGTGVFVIDGERTVTTLTDTYQRYDYGLIGGAGLDFKLPGITLSIEGRYGYGLMNLYRDPAAGESMKNTSMTALVGIVF